MRAQRQFQRTIENFTCSHCGANVSGNGYTNHCPQCLHSRHVDVQPGDRAALCRGMMEPIEIIYKAGRGNIIHRCVLCGIKRPNKIQLEDDYDQVLEIMRRQAGNHFYMASRKISI